MKSVHVCPRAKATTAGLPLSNPRRSESDDARANTARRSRRAGQELCQRTTIATGMDAIPASSRRTFRDEAVHQALGGPFRGLPNPAKSVSSPALTAPTILAISGGSGGVSPRGGSGVSPT